MISLSLQPTAHRRTFQRSLVRPSTSCHRGFSLAMGSSHGLRVHHAQLNVARFALAFASAPRIAVNLAAHGDSRTHYAKGMPQLRRAATACGHAISGLFHSPHGVLFTFPSRYSFTIGHRRVFRLGGWAPRIQTGFHVSRLTWDTARLRKGFGYGAFTLCGRPFQAVPLPLRNAYRRPSLFCIDRKSTRLNSSH